MISLALATAVGFVCTLAFPTVILFLGPEPFLDTGPRELLMWVGAAGMYHIATQPRSLRHRASRCFVAGLAHFATLTYWLDIAMTTFGGLSHWAAIPLVALLSAYCALYWASLPLLVDLMTRQSAWRRPLAFAAAIVLTEWARSLIFTGFPWGLWGYSQVRNALVLQSAHLGGVYLVSALVALSSALLAEYVRHRRTAAGSRWGLCLVVVMGATLAYGELRVRGHQPGHEEDKLQIAIAQGNIEQRIKNRSGVYQRTITDTYRKLSQEASADPTDLVLWPEAAWPVQLHPNTPKLPLDDLKATHIIGASFLKLPPNPVAYNSAILVDPKGWIRDRYSKQHLVPFGEYVPMRAILPVDKFVPGLVDYSPGTSAAPLGTAQVGILICFDGVFPEIARGEVLADARVLANLTNDGWYGISSAPYQHRDFYIMRAVETDRWVARAANSGISMFIDPLGRHGPSLGLNQRGVLRGQVYGRTSTTPYVRFGNWIVVIAGLALAWGALRRFGAGIVDTGNEGE